MRIDERDELARQSFRVRARSIAAALVDHAAVGDERDTAGARGGVECEYAHAIDFKHMTASPTPAMRQYLDAKQQHRDAIVLFRMGDFYEMFYEDALIGARALDLTLTSRSKDANGGGIPMCGVPHHAVDGYITRLVRKGFRVAICEQTEDPRKAKGVVKREVVRVCSPGTLLDAGYLDAREPSFLLAIAPGAERTGVALLDLSTGEFTTAEYVGADRWEALNDELAVLRPREIVAPADASLSDRLPAIDRAAVPVTG